MRAVSRRKNSKSRSLGFSFNHKRWCVVRQCSCNVSVQNCHLNYLFWKSYRISAIYVVIENCWKTSIWVLHFVEKTNVGQFFNLKGTWCQLKDFWDVCLTKTDATVTGTCSKCINNSEGELHFYLRVIAELCKIENVFRTFSAIIWLPWSGMYFWQH